MSINSRRPVVESGVQAAPGSPLVNASPLEFAPTPSRLEVRLSGEVRIEHVAELCARLRELCTHAAPVRIDWSAAEHLDACVLQLLVAFARGRVGAGLGVEYTTAGPELRRYLELSGFHAHLGPAEGAA
jgi:anti-anti-sigma regulatory factor